MRSNVMPEYLQGATIYKGIRLRNEDNSYVNLENKPGLVVLFYVTREEVVIVCRKDEPDEEKDELPLRKVTSQFYEIKIPHDISATMQAGIVTCDIGLLDTDVDITNFVSIASFPSFRLKECNMINYLPVAP